MNTDTCQRIFQKCQNAAFRLQSECYALQSNKGKKKLRQFIPCAKGLIYSAELSRDEPRVLSLIENEVVMTPCDCHPSFSVNQAISYECDGTFNPYTHLTHASSGLAHSAPEAHSAEAPTAEA